MTATRADVAPRARAARRVLAPRPAAALLAAGLALGATGCTFTNPQTTQFTYVPTDGQDVRDLGQGVVVGQLMVVAAAEGEPGRLVARVVNSSAEEQRVTFTGENLDEVVQAPPGRTVPVGGGDDPDSLDVIIDPVPTPPGGLMDITVAVDGGGSREVGVPVLDGTLEEYRPYLPTGGDTDEGLDAEAG